MSSSSINSVECHYAHCHRSFKSQESMLQHYTDTHSQPCQHTRLPCCIEHCNRSFHSQHDLQNHLRDAHHLDPLTAATAAASVVDDHQRILAPDLQPADLPVGNVACNDCGRTFRSTDSLHQHQWNSADHTRVSKSRNPNSGSSLRACSQCGEKFSSADRLEEHFVDQHPICEVSKTSQAGTWQHVAERFRTAWEKPSITLYAVDRIFKVYNPGSRREGFEEYRKKLKAEMADILKEDDQLELRNKVLANGNELRCYHGTTVKCQLGQPPKAMDTELAASSLCASTDCSMCRILQKGFKLSECKVERFQRFGKGIYSSTISSKASAYVNCSSSGVRSTNKHSFWSWIGIGGDDKEVNAGNYKVMIACKVLAGRPYRHSTSNLEHLNGPPPGFHSVQGDRGVVLNYEEMVVYDDRAILPEFIILYSSSD